MFQRILVPLDGSVRAEQVLPVAARLAQFSGGSVILSRVVTATPHNFGVVAETLSGQTIAVPSMVEQDVIDSEFDESRSYLEITAKSATLAGTHVETKVLFGTASLEILSAAQSLQADLIVMGSHGYTGFTRWRLGSVAQKVARHSPVPVLVLHEDAGLLTNLHPGGIRPVRILVALDGSPLAEEVLLPAAHLSAALSAPVHGALHLARVLPPISTYEYGDIVNRMLVTQEAVAEAKTYLNTVKQRLHEDEMMNLYLSITSSIAVNTDAADTLIKMAENGEYTAEIEGFSGSDAIALATHGRGAVSRWIMGSIAERILGATRLPLLIVRPQKKEAVHEKTRKTAGTVAGEAESPGTEFQPWTGLF